MRDVFAFGQPVDGLIQFAYVVPDLDAAIRDFASRLGVGPWFLRGPFVPPAGRYRGEVTDIELTLARSWAGHVMIELIVQHDEKPSVYREHIERRGYGFHHWAIGTRQFDKQVSRYERSGYSVVFSDMSPTGRRVVYMDAPDMAGMIEVVEMTPEQEQLYTAMCAACENWDGSDLYRTDDDLQRGSQ